MAYGYNSSTKRVMPGDFAKYFEIGSNLTSTIKKDLFRFLSVYSEVKNENTRKLENLV